MIRNCQDTSLLPLSHGLTNLGRTQVPHSHVKTNLSCKVLNQNGTTRRTWDNVEVQALLAIWADTLIQRQLLGVVRNTAIFNKITQELLQKGYQRDAKQCWENLSS